MTNKFSIPSIFMVDKKELSRSICEQMNSDMFDGIEKAEYNVESFSDLEIAQARESFHYNGYRTYVNEEILTARK